jgi:glutathione S-transferase
MALELHLHPLSSYCWKALIGLYELDVPFTAITVNLADPGVRADYLGLSPFGKIPALRDTDRGLDLFETSIMLEYLDHDHRLIPQDPAAARETRLMDRLFDLYVHNAFQRIVADRLRPSGQGDAFGVEQMRQELRRAYEVLDQRIVGRAWAAGESFSLADCAGAPALFYGDLIEPIPEEQGALRAYSYRLMDRPSVKRAIEGAKPFFRFYPATPEERTKLEARA